jgi:hypothetical protein
VRTLTRPELTAALAVRQGLVERLRAAPAEAIRRLTPLQAQHPPAPYLALAARVEGFTREGSRARSRTAAVVKTTINRLTLHLAAADDYPAYAQLTRQARMRTWRKQFAHLDEEKVTAELRAWFREPRSNADVREHVGAYEGVAAEPWAPVIFARTLLPLIQLPPAGPLGRQPARRVRGRPAPAARPRRRRHARARALSRRLRAREPARRRRLGRRRPARLRGPPGSGWRPSSTATACATCRGAPLPPADTPLPPRFLGHWDQVLLAYADRERIIPAELQPAGGDGQRRADVHGRRPRRRHLERAARACSRSHRWSSSRARSRPR